MPGETLKSCHQNTKWINFPRSKDSPRGRDPAGVHNSWATAQAPHLQSHLTCDVYLHLRVTETLPHMSWPKCRYSPRQRHLCIWVKERRTSPTREGVLLPHGRRCSFPDGGRTPGKEPLLHLDQLCPKNLRVDACLSAERDHCGWAGEGLRPVSSIFQHRLGPKSRGLSCRAGHCASQSPQGCPLLGSWLGVTRRGTLECLKQGPGWWKSLSFSAPGKATSKGYFAEGRHLR